MRICLSDIKYIEGKREYIKIFLEGREPITSLMSIKNMETFLPEDRFMRVHRSFIVNLDKITVVERNRIIFDRKVYIPVSDTYGERFQKYLDEGFVKP